MSVPPFVNHLGACRAKTLGDLCRAHEVIHFDGADHAADATGEFPLCKAVLSVRVPSMAIHTRQREGSKMQTRTDYLSDTLTALGAAIDALEANDVKEARFFISEAEDELAKMAASAAS